MTALVRWCAFCLAEGRRMRLDVDTLPWFEIGDRDDLSYEEKLVEYRRLADDHFQAERYAEFCDTALPHLEAAVHGWFAGDEFDRLLVSTVRSTFPAHEHEQFVAHFRGLLGQWLRERGTTPQTV
jgi:hypothetical protein